MTLFGREAETLVDLRAAQVVAAEKDIWWYEVLFLYFKMQAAMAVWPNSLFCYTVGFWCLINKFELI